MLWLCCSYNSGMNSSNIQPICEKPKLTTGLIVVCRLARVVATLTALPLASERRPLMFLAGGCLQDGYDSLSYGVTIRSTATSVMSVKTMTRNTL